MNIPKVYKLVPVELLESLLDDPALVVRMSSDKIMGIKIAMHAPTPPQPIYDEAKERELFEASRNVHTVRRNEHGDYVLPSAQDAWSGWSQCAQSRAKSVEVGHE